jgi:hypothetical protein
MLTWAWDRQKHLSASYSWFFLILIALSCGVVSGAIARPGFLGGRVFLLELLGAYVVASMVLSWRVDAPVGRGVQRVAWAVLLGPVLAPFRVMHIMWQLHRLRVVSKLARMA